MRIVVLDNGEKIVTDDSSMITPAGVEPIEEIPLKGLSELDVTEIKKNLKNDKAINKILTKIDKATSIEGKEKK